MGPGHFGIGFAAKAVAPTAPLWALLAASEALDLLSFGFVAMGIEKMGITHIDFDQGLQVVVPGSVPWLHGLMMSIVWSLFFAAITYIISKNRRTSAVIGLAVFSHWILDFIVHPPDLPLFFDGSPMFGLGLWTSGPGFIISIFLELALLVGGIMIYLIARRRRSEPIKA